MIVDSHLDRLTKREEWARLSNPLISEMSNLSILTTGILKQRREMPLLVVSISSKARPRALKVKFKSLAKSIKVKTVARESTLTQLKPPKDP
jgi:hypothetical protein